MQQTTVYAGPGPGLPEPKSKNRADFRVELHNLPERFEQHGKDIASAVLSVDIGAENLIAPNLDGSLVHRSGRLILWLRDDIDSRLMRAIRGLQAEQPTFTVVVSLNHRQLMLEDFVFENASLECLQHSLLSTQSSHETIRVKTLHGDELTGTITNSAQAESSMKLLQIAFTTMHHTIFETNDRE